MFSEWERMTAMAEDVARRLGLGTVRLHGDVATSARGALVDRFRDDPAIQVFVSTDAGGTGLNLQVASAVINLELPWNPAVLEQRIARVHRLGQRMPVRVVLLVASESYEASIAGLIAGKRRLFESVVDPTAEVDVLGLSRRTVEVALQALGPSAADGAEVDSAVEAETPSLAAEPVTGPEGSVLEARPADDVELTQRLTAIQQALGARIDRVVVTAGGLLVVVDALEPGDERFGADGVPVAVIDPRTWAALGRIGAAGSGRAVYERPAAPAPSRARVRLQAAETLLAAEQGTAAVEMAVRGMLLSLAERAMLAQPPEPKAAGLWLFGDLVPRGLVTPEEAGRAGRVLAMSAAAEVPLALARSCVTDVASIVGAT